MATMKMATAVYRVVLKTRSFRLINWYSLMLARRGYTATYQLGRGWVLYPIPRLEEKGEHHGHFQ